jgi:hypothetical protein
MTLPINVKISHLILVHIMMKILSKLQFETMMSIKQALEGRDRLKKSYFCPYWKVYS